jgi:hypothetical protein
MSPNEIIEYLKPKLQHFVKHNFVAKWQDKHLKTCVKSLSKDSIVFIVNFAKSYNFQVQNEVQNMHYHSYQINILVHITYRFNLILISTMRIPRF